ncbi:MAG: hypothetical protein Ct9H90mP13_09470 [Pseudomonadota bacterium]|nr:MAG: hypothetical protein Ct9H90mP13_09470 [Pseudomonadota bacterium]
MVILGDHPIVGGQDKGLMGAIELTKIKQSDPDSPVISIGLFVQRYFYKKGLVMRAVGDSMIIAPPLVINHSKLRLFEKAVPWKNPKEA